MKTDHSTGRPSNPVPADGPQSDGPPREHLIPTRLCGILNLQIGAALQQVVVRTRAASTRSTIRQVRAGAGYRAAAHPGPSPPVACTVEGGTAKAAWRSANPPSPFTVERKTQTGACTSICVCSSFLAVGTGPYLQEVRSGYPSRTIRWSLSRLALRLLSQSARYRSDTGTLTHCSRDDKTQFWGYPPLACLTGVLSTRHPFPLADYCVPLDSRSTAIHEFGTG